MPLPSAGEFLERTAGPVNLLAMSNPSVPAPIVSPNAPGAPDAPDAADVADLEPSSPPAQSSSTATRKRPAARGTAAYPRKRAVTACQVCRARRTKCDNKKPTCSFCEKVGATCVSSSVDLSTFDPASLKILERLDQLQDFLAAQQQQLQQQQQLILLQQEQLQEQQRQYQQRLQQDLQKRPSTPTLAVPPAPAVRVNNDVLPDTTHVSSHPLRLTFMEVISWSVFKGRWDNEPDTMTLLRRRPVERTAAASPASTDSYLLLHELNSKSGDKLLTSFLQNVHVKNPILEETRLRQMVHHACFEGLGWDAESCLILLVFALGAISIPFGEIQDLSPGNLDLATSFFNASQKRIGVLMAGGGMLAAQCFFYSGVYLMSVFDPIPAWRHFLLALACCQELEFAARAFQDSHTPLSTVSDTLPEEQRLYWSCWKSEVELRMCLDLSDFQTQDRVYPGDFPTPPADSAEDDRAWYFYLAEISLRRLNTRARNDLGRISPPYNQMAIDRLLATVAFYEPQAEAWVHSLPDIISLKSPTKDDDVLKFVLRCHLVDFYELLYWPFVEMAVNQEQRSVLTDRYTQKALQGCLDRFTTGRPGFMHRHHGTWLLMHSCARSAMVLLSAAHSPTVSELLPDGWEEAVLSAIEMLKFWENDAPDASNRRSILEKSLQSLLSFHSPVNS
ncbi:hypothetical protein F5884DRAFT_779068 [Xylogone sp. PMI_703]|nr:hypothetical protein F5884DRAFT_779068 [Xylogone sp. PMI_703]